MRIEIEPVGKPRMTRADAWKDRDCVSRYWAFKDELRLKLPGYQLPERLEVDFHLSMPETWSKKKKDSLDGQPHQQKPDIDNLCKALMDCLAEDDTHVWDLHARKFWARQGAIVIYEAKEANG